MERALAEEPEEDDEKEDEPKSNRPGQKGFAERLLSKYGWSKGKGLGADGSGIINPLSVKLEKRKKKSDAEGGGFRDSGGRGKIIGGKKNVPEKDSEVGKFGQMSEVIVLRGMVDGINLDEEVEGSGDGGLMQEIGDECAEKVCKAMNLKTFALIVEIVWASRESADRQAWSWPSQSIRQIYEPIVGFEGKTSCRTLLVRTDLFVGGKCSRRTNLQWQHNICVVL